MLKPVYSNVFFLLAKFHQKEKFKIHERSDFEGFQSPEVY
jgi:hypothetical protein